MADSLRKKIDESIGEFLRGEGFSFEECKSSEDDLYRACFYRSPRCKLKIYHAVPNGEIGWLYGLPVTENSIGDEKNGRKLWHYASELLDLDQGASIEELLAAVPDRPRSDEELLQDMQRAMSEEYEAVVAALARRGSARS